MAVLSDKDPNGTMYYGKQIRSTIYELESVLGERNSYTDETGRDWVLETEDGDVFTLYLCNYIGTPGDHELLYFSIGSKSGYAGMIAKDEIEQLLKNKK